MKYLIAAVVIGALLDVGVFSFQLVQYGRINTNSRQTTCWAGVLDEAVSSRVTRAELVVDAKACARLGPVIRPRTTTPRR